MSGELIWYCKIGAADKIAPDADAPMRNAVVKAYKEITGEEPKFLFSGWGAVLTDTEQKLVEKLL